MKESTKKKKSYTMKKNLLAISKSVWYVTSKYQEGCYTKKNIFMVYIFFKLYNRPVQRAISEDVLGDEAEQ